MECFCCVQVGGSVCGVTASNSTHIACTSTAHTAGEAEISITVDGKGLAIVSSGTTFEYVLELTNISHVFG